MFKKLCALLLASVLFLSAASVARADRWWEQSPLKMSEKIQQVDENTVTSDKYSFYLTGSVLNTFSNMILPPEGGSPGAITMMGNLMATLIGNPPVHGADYFAYMGAKAGFVDQAYAQEGGFGVLEPIREIWVATRNVAYLITSLTLVVIGFMIMMRKKLDAQTVIGVQQALPSIVITLLLITFSYAIAGFVIDLIYFVLYFMVFLLGNNIFKPGGETDVLKLIREKSIFSIGLQSLFGFGADDTAAKAIAQLFDSIFTGGLEDLITKGLGAIAGSGLGTLIISGALLFATVKLFFTLLSSYAMFLISAIFGPLMLMTNAIPGSNAFGTWIKNLLGNAAVFPATALFLILAGAMMGNTNPEWGLKPNIGFGGTSSTSWTPPLLFGTGGGAADPTRALTAIIGLGMFLLTPQFVEMVKKAFSAAGGEGYGSAIGQALQYGYSGRFSPGRLVSGGLGGAQALGGATLGLTGAHIMRGIMQSGRLRGIQDVLSPNRSYQERLAEDEWNTRHSRTPEAKPPVESAPAGPGTEPER